MNLENSIRSWNGKSVEEIERIFDLYSSETSFVDAMLKLLGIAECQKGASWLLKAYLEKTQSISKKQTTQLINKLVELRYWESKLQVLQSLGYLEIEEKSKLKVEHFLRSTLTDNNKFVRAWSYNGFYELAKQYPEYKTETLEFFEMAMRDEPASVKARIRNILKKGF